MGKATIVSGGTDGKYTIKLDYGKTARDDRVRVIDKRLVVLATEIEAARLDLNLEKIIYAQAEAEAESAINDYVLATQAIAPAFEAVKSAAETYQNKLASATATPEEKAAAKAALAAAEAAYKVAQQSVVEALKEQTGTAVKLVDSKKKIAPYQLKMELLQDEKTQLQKDKAYQAGLKLEETKEAWCADFSEDATGLVETMEIPGEDLKVLIGPQDEGHKLTNVGALVAREVQTPEQVFFNAAILPGWQKFKPMYRRGVVLAVDQEGDTADVKFDDDKSSAQKLDINRYKQLTGIPVKYMACNAGVFEVGDRCVVKFTNQDWSFPVVVGFVDHPKACLGGIGLEMDAGADIDMRILRPPVTGAQWRSRAVNELNGGLAYAVNGGLSFVESGAGLCRSNKRAAGPLHGADKTPQFYASRTFPISGLFIRHGMVSQLKADGDALLMRGMVTKDLPGGAVQTASYALPNVPTPGEWAMVSATPEGAKFSACKVAADEGTDEAPYVCAVADFVGAAAAGGPIELASVQYFTQQVAARTPDDAQYKAPTYAGFSGVRERVNDTYTVSVYNGNVNYDANAITYKNDSIYQDKSSFEAESIYRAYLSADGSAVVDTIKHTVKAEAKDALLIHAQGYETSLSNYSHSSDKLISVDVLKVAEINFNNTQKVKTHSTKIKYSYRNYSAGSIYSAFSHYKYTPEGEISGYINAYSASFGASKAVDVALSRDVQVVLCVDEQFSVVVCIKASIQYGYSLSGGINQLSASGDDAYFDQVWNAGANRGTETSPPFTIVPDTDASSLTPVQASLEILHAGSTYSEAMDASSFNASGAKAILDAIARSNVIVSNGRDYVTTADDGIGNVSGFVKGDLLFEGVLRGFTEGWVAENLSQVMYAKDPKTGLGFLSFMWGTTTSNYVVGPWGVAPSISRTDVPSDAKLRQLVSI